MIRTILTRKLRLSLTLTATLMLSFFSSVSIAGETKGTVIETMNAANYTYMNVKTATETVWVAIPATTIEKGAEVNFTDGMTMENFTSKSLGKTFKSIIFSPGLANAAEKPAAADTEEKKTENQEASSSFAAAVKREGGKQQAATPTGQTTTGSAGATVPAIEAQVTKAEGENSYTVGEIFEQANSLNGKKIMLRGRVVKVSPNIMGKNWIHVQDGTGDPMKNTHDLVVTSTDMAEVDHIILVEGTMAAKKDFGFGYKYDAIIEEAALTKQPGDCCPPAK